METEKQDTASFSFNWVSFWSPFSKVKSPWGCWAASHSDHGNLSYQGWGGGVCNWTFWTVTSNMLKDHLSRLVQNVLFAPQIWSWPCLSGWVMPHVPRAALSSPGLCIPGCPAWFVRRGARDKGQDLGLEREQAALLSAVREASGQSRWLAAGGRVASCGAGQGGLCVPSPGRLGLLGVLCWGLRPAGEYDPTLHLTVVVGFADPRTDRRHSGDGRHDGRGSRGSRSAEKGEGETARER